MKFLRNKFAAIWISGISAAMLVWILSAVSGSLFSRLDTLIFDSYQRIQPRVWEGANVAIVDIDERSIQHFGQWPWPRTVVADLVDRLGELGAAAIVFDVVFSEPDRTSPLKAVSELTRAGASVRLPAKTEMLDNDLVLTRAFARHPVVTGFSLTELGTDIPPDPKAGVGFIGTVPPDLMSTGVKAVRNLPALDKAAAGIGEIGFVTDGQVDAVVRRTKLLRGVDESYYPSLAMEALRVAQGAGGFKIKSSDGSGEAGGGDLAIVSAQVGALTIPTNAQGDVEVYHSPFLSKTILPVHAVLDAGISQLTRADLEREIANRIVLIGTSAAGLLDLRATPLEPIVPGVTIHAEIIDQIITGTYLKRPDYARGVELVAAFVAVLILLSLLPILNPYGDATATVLLLCICVLGCWFAFSIHNFLFSPVIPALSILMAASAGVSADLLATQKDSRFVRTAFGQYISPSLVKQLAEKPESLKLGGETRELSVLFTDVRGFTTISESFKDNPQGLTDLMNRFLTVLSDAILRQNGTIDKFMGDAVMAFWNAPIDQPEHADAAARSAIDMISDVEALNVEMKKKVATREARGESGLIHHTINVGIGINSGRCVVGNMGSDRRFDYTALGDAVNLASRLEGQSKPYGIRIVLGSTTVELLKAKFALFEIDQIRVKGKNDAERIFGLFGAEELAQTPDFIAAKALNATMLSCYRAQNWDGAFEALELLRDLDLRLGLNLDDYLFMYETRISEFRANPPGRNWDGVYSATAK